MTDRVPQTSPDSGALLQREDFERAMQSMDTYLDISLDDLMALNDRANYYAEQRSRERLLLAGIMTNPVLTIGTDASMSEAAHIMVSKRISGLPVVDTEGRLAGIITEADFLRGLGVPTHNPALSFWQTLELLASHLHHHDPVEKASDAVSAHMTTDVVYTMPEQDIFHVLEVMKKHGIKRVPVCDKAMRPAGMITRSDLVRVFFDRYTDQGKPSSTP